MMGNNWRVVETELLKKPGLRAEFDALRPQYEVIEQIIRARNEQGLSQEALAERSGIQRGSLSRLECGNYNPSLGFLSKLANGLGMEIHVEFRHRDGAI